MNSTEPIHVKDIPHTSILNSLSFKQTTDRILLIIMIIALLLARSIWLPRASATVYTPALHIIENNPSNQVRLQNTLLFDFISANLLCANFISIYDDAVKNALISISKSGISWLTCSLYSYVVGVVEIVIGVCQKFATVDVVFQSSIISFGGSNSVSCMLAVILASMLVSCSIIF